jgi:hypothetical protein
MVKIEKFEIVLEKKDANFIPGEVIKGKLFIETLERLKINAICIYITGVFDIVYFDLHNMFISDHKHTLDKCNFLYEEGPALTKKDGEKYFYLEIGKKSYSFTLKLPDHQCLPSSLLDKSYSIKYKVCGLMHLRNHVSFKKTFRDIQVFNGENLNSFPELRKAVIEEAEFGKIKLKFSILKGGYVIGENIILNATIENNSSNDIEKVSFKLVRSYYIEQSKLFHMNSEKTIIKVSYNKMIAKLSNEEIDLKLLIPFVCPTKSTVNEGLKIKVSYFVVLKIKKERLHSARSYRIPINIGGIAFSDTNTPQQIVSSDTNMSQSIAFSDIAKHKYKKS